MALLLSKYDARSHLALPICIYCVSGAKVGVAIRSWLSQLWSYDLASEIAAVGLEESSE